jgi:5-methylcytosine-specific restriction endonuclease McrA
MIKKPESSYLPRMRASRKDSASTHCGLSEFIVSLSRRCKFSEKQAKEAHKENRTLSPEKQKKLFNKTGGHCHFCGDRLTLKLYGGRTRRDLNLAEQEEIFKKTGGLCHFCPTNLRLDGYVGREVISPEIHTKEQWKAVGSRRNFFPVCVPCYKSRWQADHIVYAVSGGSDDLENLLPICNPCNRSRSFLSGEQLRIFIRIAHFVASELRGGGKKDEWKPSDLGWEIAEGLQSWQRKNERRRKHSHEQSRV